MVHGIAPAGGFSTPPILVATDLRKSYGNRPALRGLTLSLEPGRILGFLGPNGAGKTTAIRILTTMMEPDGGSFTVDGVGSENPEEIRRRIGVLPESLGFHKHMTGLETLTFFGRLYGLSAKDARAKSRALLKEVGLEARATSTVGSYSRGMRQRLGIARTLVNDPAVVFLDEPTLGLDPRGQQELLELIRDVAGSRRVAIVLCSHALPEVESVCDDVIILNVGQVVASGPVADVIGRTQREVMQRNSIRLQVPPESIAAAQHALAAVANVARVTATGETAGWLRVDLVSTDGASTQARAINNKILEALIRGDIAVLNFETEGGRLQEVFLHLTEEAIR
jgi:ABC-2 type transport system ATP-binding protein